MCPACLSAATIAALSGGGIAAVVVALRKNRKNGVRPRFRDFLNRRRAVSHPDLAPGEEKPDADFAHDLRGRTT